MLELNNYKAISVGCRIGKIIEKGMQCQLLDYLVKHDFISVDQSAHLRNYSPQTCLYKVTGGWFSNINGDLITAICFLDIHKCFHTINHDNYIGKLEKYRILDKELPWFSYYICNRRHVVSCNGNLCNKEIATIGVPHGSTLCPLLFLIQLNDIIPYVIWITTKVLVTKSSILCTHAFASAG